ncbi:jerky protein homolog-like [Argopecten irradians]|uniref:jerky protein homolog-like n=1 Tax=Argopecten irradians TaxID=31199 RepID=UPI00371F3139
MPHKSKGIYQKTNDDRMHRAVNAVRNEGLSVRKAAEAFGIAKSTLSDHVSGKVALGSRSGRKTVFPAEVEKEMVEIAQRRANEGFGLSRQQLLGKAARLATNMKIKTPFKGGKPGQAWWDGFRQRNPSIALRKPEKLSSIRARNMNQVTLSNYFQDLSEVITSLNLQNSPDKIWNMDETGCQLEHKPVSVIARKGARSVPGVVGNSRESATMLPCINAAGKALSPMIIVKGKTPKSLNGFDRENGPVNAVWTYQGKAWIEESGTLKWLNDVFLKEIGPQRPQLLILDQHISHEGVDFLEEAKKNNIHIFALPPHTTHFLCPLDRCVFGPFKKFYNKVCSEFTSSSPGNLVLKWTWPGLLKKAYEASFTSHNIQQGFKACGIFPLNPEAIPADAIAPSQPTDDTKNISDTDMVASVPHPLSAATPSETACAPGNIPEIDLDMSPFNVVSEVSVEDFEDLQLLSQIALGSEITVDETEVINPSSTVSCDPLWSSAATVPSPSTQSTSASADWNMELNNLFSFKTQPVARTPKPKGKKRITSHRLLTSETLIQEKKQKKEAAAEKMKLKMENAEKKKEKALITFLKKMK